MLLSRIAHTLLNSEIYSRHLARSGGLFYTEMLPRALTHWAAGPSSRCMSTAASTFDNPATPRAVPKRRSAPAEPGSYNQGSRLTPGGRAAPVKQQRPAAPYSEEAHSQQHTIQRAGTASSARAAASKANNPTLSQALTAQAEGIVFPIPAPIKLPEGDPYAGPVYPTHVPRNPGIKDGIWNASDAAIVVQAQRDADKVVLAKNPDAKGESPDSLASLMTALHHSSYPAHTACARYSLHPSMGLNPNTPAAEPEKRGCITA